MGLRRRGIFAWLLLIAASSNAYADAKSAACPVINKVSEPTIYLVNKDNKLVAGPVNFGTFVTREDFASDYMVKDTQYRAVLFPARLGIVNEKCNICISVQKIAPICPDSSTYAIGVGMVFKGLPGAVSPYEVDDPFEFRFVDKKVGVDPQVKLEFDARIVGVLIKRK